MKKVLITGVTGFVGSHLAEYTLNEMPQVEIYGTTRIRSRMENIRDIADKIITVNSDLKDYTSTMDILSSIEPDIIFHLAAQSFVPMSWKAPAETLDTNIISTLNILEASRTLPKKPRIHLACSSEEYGMVKESELPITEKNPLRPLSPYGVSKVAQDMLGYQYFMSYKLPVYRTRAFNHTGPRRTDSFVTSNFAKQIVEIEIGRKRNIKVGNLDTIRDFTDVRDIVRAYWLCVEKCEPGEVYNVCSGIGRRIKDVLDGLISLSDICGKIDIEIDKKRMRPSDVPILIGSSKTFTDRTGWKPQIPWEKTLGDLLNYWRERLK